MHFKGNLYTIESPAERSEKFWKFGVSHDKTRKNQDSKFQTVTVIIILHSGDYEFLPLFIIVVVDSWFVVLLNVFSLRFFLFDVLSSILLTLVLPYWGRDIWLLWFSFFIYFMHMSQFDYSSCHCCWSFMMCDCCTFWISSSVFWKFYMFAKVPKSYY